MATPLTIAVPPLREGQTIAEWQHLFVAAVSSMEGKAAVKLLPAYVKRGKLEEEYSGTIGKDTLEDAFKYLKEKLDPEEDEFEAAAKFRRMTWTPGEPAPDFFARYLEEACKAGITPKTACTFMVSQAPVETQQKLMEWVKSQDNALSLENALHFGSVLRKVLGERGIPVDRGCRIQQVEALESKESQQRGGPSDDSADKSDPANSNVHFVRKQSYRGAGRRQPPKCYSCGSTEHFIRFFPNRYCSVCGEAGHKSTSYSKRDKDARTERSYNFQKRNVYQVSAHEEAVTVEVKIGFHRVATMLNTGAKPSVIDLGTLRQLELEENLVPAKSNVYDLCNNPVKVNGYVGVTIQIGKLEPVVERMQVLDSEEATLLLGRRFMGHLGLVTFDWANSRVKIGHSWIDTQSSLSGATPLARARVAKQNESIEEVALAEEQQGELFSNKLSTIERSELASLVDGFAKLFSRNH